MTTLDMYQTVKFEQLSVANNSSVLYYSRDKYSTVLAKKLKPEFARFFISSEVKDCMKLLGKITNDKLDASTNIDIMLIEADKSTVNLVDYLNKRPLADDTSNCPLIPIVLLLNDDNVGSDFICEIGNAGNVNRIIRSPAKTKDILFGIIEVLHTRNKIEDTFKDLKKQKIITSKYPYLPLFDRAKNESSSQDTPAGVSTINHSTTTTPQQHSRHNNVAIDEIDDGTECSSLLPNFVTSTRLQSPLEYDHRQSKLHGQFSTRLLANKYDALDEILTKEGYDAEAASVGQDRKALGMSESRKLQQQAEEEERPRTKRNLDEVFKQLNDDTDGNDARKLKDLRQYGTNEAVVDERYVEADNDDTTHLPTGTSSRNLRTTTGTGGLLPPAHNTIMHTPAANDIRKGGSAQKYAGNEKALLLLDPQNRPTWNGTLTTAPTTTTTAGLNNHNGGSGGADNDDLSVDEHMPAVAANDLYPFINKSIPKVNVRYTVGGLEKRLADSHWKILNKINMKRNPDSTKSSSDMSLSPPKETPKHGNRGHAPLSRKLSSTTDSYDMLPMVSSNYDSHPPTPSRGSSHSQLLQLVVQNNRPSTAMNRPVSGHSRPSTATGGSPVQVGANMHSNNSASPSSRPTTALQQNVSVNSRPGTAPTVASGILPNNTASNSRPSTGIAATGKSNPPSRPSTLQGLTAFAGGGIADVYVSDAQQNGSEGPSSPSSPARQRQASINFRTAANTIVKTMGLHVDTKPLSGYDMLPVLLPTTDLRALKEKSTVVASKTSTISATAKKLQNKKAVSASIQAIENSTREVFTAAKNAEKNIIKLSQGKPFDIQVSTLLDIDLYNRKINLGERDLLEKGLKSEQDGDYRNASVCYQRAGSHSKDQHISKILMGNLYYHKNQLMEALKYYTIALDLLTGKKEHSRIHEDEFIAYHNRGIIYFRLGADDSGLADMETAIRLRPTHEATREVLSLAKRRMGKFTAAIADAISNKTLRNEKRRNELIAEIDRQTERRVSVFMSGTKVDPRIAMLDRMCSDNVLPILQSENVIQRKDSTGSIKSRNSSHASVESQGQHNIGVVVSNTPFSHSPTNKVSFQDPPKDSNTSTQPQQVSPVSQQQQFGNNKQNTTIPTSSRSSFYMSQNSENAGLNMAARIMQTRGYCLDIPEYSCQNGLQDKIRDQKKMMRGDMVDNNNTDGGFLKVFKLNHGYKLELFDDLFIKPSDLQEALLLEPNKRMVYDIEVIATTLRLFPFLRSLSDSCISDLANIVEYRALTIQEELFSQNMPASVMCLLLKGTIQVKMLNKLSHLNEDILLGDLPQYSAFGHIDFLFRHTNSAIIKEVEEVLFPKVMQKPSGQFQTRYQHNASATDQQSFQQSQSAAVMESAGGLTGGNVTNNNNLSAMVAGANDSTANMTVGESLLARKIVNGEELDRSLSPGMFMSYGMHSMCELLMVAEKDFERILLASALEDLKRRLEVIKSSCVFASWSRNDHIRLARMGQVRTYKRGELILAQGVKPSFLYIVMKGMCKVTKKPNRTEMLVQKLQIAREKAERHDLKYTYHHKLKDVLTKATTVDTTTDMKDVNANRPSTTYTHKPLDSNSSANRPLSHSASRSKLLTPSSNSNNNSRRNSHGNNTPHNSRGGVLSKSMDYKKHQLLTINSDVGSNTSELHTHNESSVFHQVDLNHMTEAESIREQLQQEIVRLEQLIQRATIQDAKDSGKYNNDMFGASGNNSRCSSPPMQLNVKLTKGKFMSNHSITNNGTAAGGGTSQHSSHNSSFGQHGGGGTANTATGSVISGTTDSILKNKVAEIAVLQWPNIFGEACILDPENGCSRGTIVADTLCEVFLLHKTQIQTFPVDDTFLEKVKAKATLYPGDPDIVVSLYRKQEWKQYKTELMETISKDRWPTKIAEYEPFNV